MDTKVDCDMTIVSLQQDGDGKLIKTSTYNDGKCCGVNAQGCGPEASTNYTKSTSFSYTIISDTI